MTPPRGNEVEPGGVPGNRPDNRDRLAGTTPRSTSLPTRRELVRHGARLAFVAPAVSTFFASQAYAANYSCYAAGHACPGDEACCAGLTCVDGVCSQSQDCVQAGELCFGDADCCSGDCRFGVCQ